MKSLVIALLLAIVPGSAAVAASPVGEWRSSSGTSFVIPPADGPTFDIIRVGANGERQAWLASWVPGLEGTQFTFKPIYENFTGTFDSRNSSLLQVRGQSSVVTWTRTGALPISTVSGRWKSTSGAQVVVTPPLHGASTFEVLVIASSGVRSLFVARWVPGLEGTQFTYVANGYPRTGTVEARSLSTIRIASEGAATIWTRLDRAPGPDLAFDQNGIGTYVRPARPARPSRHSRSWAEGSRG